MKILQLALCGFVLALSACTDSPVEVTAESAAELASSPQSSTRELPSASWIQLLAGPIIPTTTTCTWTQTGACRVGRCELGANDSFEKWDEVCCDTAGSCTTTHWRICGC